MHALDTRVYEKMSPFEIKDELIRLARASSQRSAHVFLNAGRGNPNWLATKPREAFFLLGHFAINESKRVMEKPGLAGMPEQKGCGERLMSWLDAHQDWSGAPVLRAMVRFAVDKFGFDLDDFVHELVDAVVGDNYPTPDRMLVHAEQVVRRYLDWAMCSNTPPSGKFELFATEGGTGAIAYVFKSLMANRILKKGDTIAIATPIFTPYLEIPELEDYALNVVYLRLREEDQFQLTDEEVAKLAGPKVKALFLVNPANPTSVALSDELRGKIIELVHSKRSDLIILTDDVYGTFVKGFRSLVADLPQNTIGVYSFSKYFGCTGWRLGVIMLHENNILDRMIAALPEADKSALDRRYGSLALEPRKIKMIDRFVAESKDVAQNHTAGLGTPQQAMMVLLSLTQLMDEAKEYQSECVEMLKHRVQLCADGLGIERISDPLFAGYYGEVDLEFWLRKYIGEDVVDWIKQKVHPLDIVFKLAEDYGIVALNGGGFQGPDWSCRLSFANLSDSAYEDIGRAIRSVARGYLQAFRASEEQAPAKANAALAKA